MALVRVVIGACDLPGRTFGVHVDVHVALQVRREPVAPIPGDAASARWETEVTVVDGDFRGPGQARRAVPVPDVGVPLGDDWQMFRRAKLMLDAVDPAVVDPLPGFARAWAWRRRRRNGVRV